jgi:hypothetical protein
MNEKEMLIKLLRKGFYFDRGELCFGMPGESSVKELDAELHEELVAFCQENEINL